MNNTFVKYDSATDSLRFIFNGQDGAVFFKTQAYICNGVNPSGGYLKDIVKGSDFWNFLNTEVILCKNIA